MASFSSSSFGAAAPLEAIALAHAGSRRRRRSSTRLWSSAPAPRPWSRRGGRRALTILPAPPTRALACPRLCTLDPSRLRPRPRRPAARGHDRRGGSVRCGWLRGIDDLDAVMDVMDDSVRSALRRGLDPPRNAPGCPCPGVADAGRRRGGGVIGFSLLRTVADEAELLLLAVRRARSGAGSAHPCSSISSTEARGSGCRRCISKSGTAIRQSPCIRLSVSRRAPQILLRH